MNIDLHKEIKNPFKKFLSNICLGLILLIIALGGCLIGGNFLNSNKVDDDTNAAAATFMRIYIAQKVHYDKYGIDFNKKWWKS